MRQKRWDLQLGNTLHIIDFEHGKVLKKHRRLLVDGEPAEPQNWRVYSGKKVVTEYPFRWKEHIFTVVIVHEKRNNKFDLLLDGLSVETGQAPDLLALSEPKSTWDKLKETFVQIIILILITLFFGFFRT